MGMVDEIGLVNICRQHGTIAEEVDLPGNAIGEPINGG